MATSTATKTSSLNHVPRFLPSTADQKRLLQRSVAAKTSIMRPSTTAHSKYQKVRGSSSRSLILNEPKSAPPPVHDSDDYSDYEDNDTVSIGNRSEIEKFSIGNRAEPLMTTSDVMEDAVQDKLINDTNASHKQSLMGKGHDKYDFHQSSTEWDTDIEENEEVKKDHSNEAVYFDQCRKQKIIPASYFVRHMNDQILSLKHHGLGAPGVRPVSAALTNNSIVTKLDLSDNWLGSDGALYISKMLRDNCSITDLNLSDNRLSTRGADLLKDALKQSSCLTHLTLQGNNFDDSTAPIWADIILNTIKIEYLDLSHNNFGEESGKIFGSAISENTSIKTFIINWNNIRRKGAIAIAKGLANNQGIRKFEIGWNGLSQDGAKAFFKTIKENETLEELDLSNNRIATEGAVYIAKALMANQTLRVLKMGMNPMESAGCFSIIKTLQKNPNSKLEVIDFSEIIVDKYFRDEYKNFQVIFPNTKVITGCDGVPLKPKVKIHPVVKLRNYVEKHNVKLIDIFNKFDKDGSMTVTRDEFKQGLLSLGINLNEDELNQLMTELDSDQDGEINYRNLVRLTATFA